METTHLIIMGVSGSGKTTIATILSQRLGWQYAEADDFHPSQNIVKMAQGMALNDEDRGPWLEIIHQWMSGKAANDESTVVTCSALKRSYREILNTAEGRVRFIHLEGDPELIRGRLNHRSSHFMPASLLDSQFDALEPLQAEEDGVAVPNSGTPEETAENIILQLRAAV